MNLNCAEFQRKIPDFCAFTPNYAQKVETGSKYVHIQEVHSHVHGC